MDSSVKDVPVVILCGGQGTRLREETDRVPKPLVTIGAQPILWHIMKIYRHYGFRRFVLCLGYKSWLIKDYFLSYREHLGDFTIDLSGDHQPVFHDSWWEEDWEVTCVETGLDTGTGARLVRVRDYVDSETFMFTYGDGIGRVNLEELFQTHMRSGLAATVTGVHPTSRYGEMQVEGEEIIEFNEKPTVPTGFVSGGFFVFTQKVFDYLDDDPGLLLEHEPLQRLARDRQLALYPHTEFWMGMDTYRDYQALNDLWGRGDPPWKVWDD
ncbi:glucose-1-phosphate cytidylyltransferase [soil metagenome]